MMPRILCNCAASYTRSQRAGALPLLLVIVAAEYADEVVESILLRMLGESERLERERDAGSDHSAELADIDAELEDLVSVLGSGDFRAGTPQRVRLNERISSLATRQAELSAETVKPAGWTWQPTGEKFGDWWARRDITARNVWLRSMNVRLEFEQGQVHLDLGEIFGLTQQMNASGPVADWQHVLTARRDNAIAAMQITGGDIQLTTT
jgi:site-specific DNA recombinase